MTNYVIIDKSSYICSLVSHFHEKKGWIMNIQSLRLSFPPGATSYHTFFLLVTFRLEVLESVGPVVMWAMKVLSNKLRWSNGR